MDKDDVLKRIAGMVDRVQPAEPPPTAARKITRARRSRRVAPTRATKQGAPRLEDLLEQFTPDEAFAFLYERTVPPADEDGLALIAAYPELRAAAPELVDDMAVAFRRKERHEYAAYFELVAKHHGLEGGA